MKHTFSVTSLISADPTRGLELRSAATMITVETDLGPFPQTHPKSFEGTVVDITDEQLYRLKFDDRVVAMVEGVGYIFEKIEKDGTFKLTKRVFAAAKS